MVLFLQLWVLFQEDASEELMFIFLDSERFPKHQERQNSFQRISEVCLWLTGDGGPRRQAWSVGILQDGKQCVLQGDPCKKYRLAEQKGVQVTQGATWWQCPHCSVAFHSPKLSQTTRQVLSHLSQSPNYSPSSLTVCLKYMVLNNHAETPKI